MSSLQADRRRLIPFISPVIPCHTPQLRNVNDTNRFHRFISRCGRILSGRETRPRLDNVQAIARALGVEVRLGETVNVVETHTAHEFQKAQAHDKARHLVGMVQGNMALEAQAVDSRTMDELVERTAAELLTGPRRRLWDD